MNTRHHPAPWALLLLVALAPTARAQDQVYNEDWVDPGQVPPAVRASDTDRHDPQRGEP